MTIFVKFNNLGFQVVQSNVKMIVKKSQKNLPNIFCVNKRQKTILWHKWQIACSPDPIINSNFFWPVQSSCFFWKRMWQFFFQHGIFIVACHNLTFYFNLINISFSNRFQILSKTSSKNLAKKSQFKVHISEKMWQFFYYFNM